MKNFKFFALIWAILLAAWCAVVFLARSIIPGFTVAYDARFWVAFIFVLAAFAGNLVCAYFAFRAENLKKMFLNLPLITVSWSALIAMLVVSAIVMVIPDFPAWIAAILCILILAFNAIAVVKAVWAADAVSKVDEKVKTQTAYIKMLTVDTENILARAKSEAVKAECRKVYEAVRYSDPMSCPELSVAEAKITVKMDEFSGAVAADDAAKAGELADELIILIGDRNRMCKALK